MRHHSIRATVALLVALSALAAVPGATGQGLWGRLRSSKSRKAAVKTQLRNIKAEQATQRNALSAAQVQAGKARAAYRSAKNKLVETRKNLRSARADLDVCEVRLEEHDNAVCARVTVMFAMGEPSYLEVLLDATTFADFVERAEYMRRVAESDANLLVRFTNERKQADALRKRLEVVQAQEERQARELSRRKAAAEAKEATAAALLKQANTERAAAEQQFAELEKVSKEIEELLSRVQRGLSNSGLRYGGQWNGWGSAPIRAGYRVSSGFGMRFHPILKRRKHHRGVDLSCPTGTPIHAAATGRVVHSGWWGVLGKAVLIDHGGGWSTVYGHCSRLAISAGQNVTAGQVIGYVGSTGRSTGPHLHYGVRKYGKCINPAGAY